MLQVLGAALPSVYRYRALTHTPLLVLVNVMLTMMLACPVLVPLIGLALLMPTLFGTRCLSRTDHL